MKIVFGNLFFALFKSNKSWPLGRIITSLICTIFLCGCAGSDRTEIKPAAGLKLQALKPDLGVEETGWQVLASSEDIENLIYLKDSSGVTEIWFDFSVKRYKEIMKFLFDTKINKFRVVVDGKIVYVFEFDESALIGRPGVCIRMQNEKEARRIYNSLGHNK